MTKELTEIEEITARYPVLAQDAREVAEMIKTNIGPGSITEFDMERLKVPAGGGVYWTIPSLEGKPEMAEEVVGIVVHWKEPRAYWRVPYDESGGGTPPDCSSEDGFTGIGEPGGDCSDCALAQFGSAPAKGGNGLGRGQACKQMRVMFVLSEGLMLPQVIVAPPTSLKSVRQFFLRLTSRMVPLHGCIVGFKLEEDKNAEGTPYSKIVPRLVRQLAPEQHEKIKAYADALMPAFRRAVDLGREDYEAS